MRPWRAGLRPDGDGKPEIHDSQITVAGNTDLNPVDATGQTFEYSRSFPRSPSDASNLSSIIIRYLM